MPSSTPSLFSAPTSLPKLLLHASWYRFEAIEKSRAKDKLLPNGDSIALELVGTEGQHTLR